ncbi:MAG TPA: hypothetical protein VHN17_12980 [Steroidobacteraceae bacterium]|jgi:hypothetical protein|nr:hypothetical protein [Steroidobacteraceae bacterium]
MKTYPLLLVVPLACPSFGVAQSAPQQPSSAHVWRQSQQTNTADAYTYLRFTLHGKFLTASHDGVANRPALVVNCIPVDESPRDKATFLTGNLIVGSTLRIVYVEPEEIRGISYFPKVAVRYRTDDAKREVDEQWSPRSDKISASIPKHSLKEILRAHTVTITAEDDQGKQLAMQFDMPDPTLVEQGCNVDKQ